MRLDTSLLPSAAGRRAPARERWLSQDPAAVHTEGLARDEGAVRTGEEAHRVRDVLGQAPAWDRLAGPGQAFHLRLVRERLQLLLRPDRARHHRVHPYARRPEGP